MNVHPESKLGKARAAYGAALQRRAELNNLLAEHQAELTAAKNSMGDMSGLDWEDIAAEVNDSSARGTLRSIAKGNNRGRCRNYPGGAEPRCGWKARPADWNLKFTISLPLFCPSSMTGSILSYPTQPMKSGVNWLR